jgi:hypothetical protein
VFVVAPRQVRGALTSSCLDRGRDPAESPNGQGAHPCHFTHLALEPLGACTTSQQALAMLREALLPAREACPHRDQPGGPALVRIGNDPFLTGRDTVPSAVAIRVEEPGDGMGGDGS